MQVWLKLFFASHLQVEERKNLCWRYTDLDPSFFGMSFDPLRSSLGTLVLLNGCFLGLMDTLVLVLAARLLEPPI